MHSLTGVIQAV